MTSFPSLLPCVVTSFRFFLFTTSLWLLSFDEAALTFTGEALTVNSALTGTSVFPVDVFVAFTVAVMTALSSPVTSFAVTRPLLTMIFLLSDFHTTFLGSVLSKGSKATLKNAFSPPFIETVCPVTSVPFSSVTAMDRVTLVTFTAHVAVLFPQWAVTTVSPAPTGRNTPSAVTAAMAALPVV